MIIQKREIRRTSSPPDARSNKDARDGNKMASLRAFTMASAALRPRGFPRTLGTRGGAWTTLAASSSSSFSSSSLYIPPPTAASSSPPCSPPPMHKQSVCRRRRSFFVAPHHRTHRHGRATRALTTVTDAAESPPGTLEPSSFEVRERETLLVRRAVSPVLASPPFLLLKYNKVLKQKTESGHPLEY